MIVSQRFQAPRQHGAVLAVPPLAEAGRLLAENRRPPGLILPPILDRSFAEVRDAARRALLAEAGDYLRRAGEPVPSDAGPSQALILTGHQPELFHPGVWVKNFALHGLARAHGGTPVNLVIDTDLARSVALKVPSWEADGPVPEVDPAAVRRWTVPFDRWAPEAPYEERRVLDEAQFAGLPERVAGLTRHWPFSPLLTEFWEDVLRQAQRTELLGERFAAARRAWERRWGCHNLEVPMSRLCRTEPFGWFAGDVLAQLPRFHTVYNEAVREYRRRHGIRSPAHPVPDLAAEGDWLEAPFWAWRAGGARRGRLLARVGPRTVTLRVDAEPGPELPREQLVRAGPELERQGFKLRSRALTTTLFARLFLSDLFIHGIGGAKYDELTDAIIRRFHGLEPPGFLTLSATLLLPFPAYPAGPEDCRHLARRHRDLLWNPQRHLDDGAALSPAARELAERRRDWVTRQPGDSAGRRERFHELQTLTRQLRQYVGKQEANVRRERETCRRQLDANAVLRRRDYAFCLFPEEMLEGYYSQFLGGPHGPPPVGLAGG